MPRPFYFRRPGLAPGPQRERNCAHRGGEDSRFQQRGRCPLHQPTPGVMGPGARPGRREWVFRIHQTTTRLTHTFAFSRQHLPEVCKFISPQKRKRAQGRPGARCTRGLACQDAHSNNAHEHTGSAEAVRPSLRNGFNGLFRALPGETRACLSPSSRGNLRAT